MRKSKVTKRKVTKRKVTKKKYGGDRADKNFEEYKKREVLPKEKKEREKRKDWYCSRHPFKKEEEVVDDRDYDPKYNKLKIVHMDGYENPVLCNLLDEQVENGGYHKLMNCMSDDEIEEYVKKELNENTELSKEFENFNPNYDCKRKTMRERYYEDDWTEKKGYHHRNKEFSNEQIENDIKAIEKEIEKSSDYDFGNLAWNKDKNTSTAGGRKRRTKKKIYKRTYKKK
jgi:hypothetical protein